MSCRSKRTRTTRAAAAADEQQEKLGVAHAAIATCPRFPTRDTFFNAIQIGSRTHIASSGIISSAVLFSGPIRMSSSVLVVDLLN